MDATPTARRREISGVVVASALFCVMGSGLFILFAPRFGIARIADVARQHKRTEAIILTHALAGPTGRIEDWIGGMWISIEGNLKLKSGGNSLKLRASPNGLAGTGKGMLAETLPDPARTKAT